MDTCSDIFPQTNDDLSDFDKHAEMQSHRSVRFIVQSSVQYFVVAPEASSTTRHLEWISTVPGSRGPRSIQAYAFLSRFLDWNRVGQILLAVAVVLSDRNIAAASLWYELCLVRSSRLLRAFFSCRKVDIPTVLQLRFFFCLPRIQARPQLYYPMCCKWTRSPLTTKTINKVNHKRKPHPNAKRK